MTARTVETGAARAPTAISVSIARDAALVRTVRLVAASFARRATSGEDFVEEVRLAVGEACALLVGPETSRSPDAVPRHRGMVEVSMDLEDRLRVVVKASGALTVQDPLDGDIDGIEPWALLRGLTDDFEIHQDAGGTVLSMSWAVS